MATNKNAQIRYQILDRCFRNSGRRYFIEDLINECNKVLKEINPDSSGISRRQVFDDIAFMESAEGWCIELLRKKENRRVFYQYKDLSYSINNMPLDETELNCLLTSLQTISQFKGMPQFEWMSDLLIKLRQKNGSYNSHYNTIMEFESNQYLTGIEHIGTIYNSILYQKVLKVEYLQSFKDSVQLTIHPYYLKEYNNRWFVFGYNPEQDKSDWNLSLDRIVEISEANQPYILNTQIDWNEYFDDIIGVTKPNDEKVENLTLHFYGKTGHYITSKPIHGSQRHHWLDSNTLEVKIDVIINYEMEQLILSFCDSVKVIQPLSLRGRIMDKMKKAYIEYLK
ncbi:YafY family protein [Bacteroides sp. 519]|uniref:helix-turn-helix transcriptional regulator n=1 Tax=Bacteroides sp. 519 TaxID=2302937 RepID=UPI0013CF7F50|nr:WYL domain-containing protein [Bacteroides sp. 519]NDV59286.1 WYL domain-containing protein [Bacteroides sp. 519]